MTDQTYSTQYRHWLDWREVTAEQLRNYPWQLDATLRAREEGAAQRREAKVRAPTAPPPLTVQKTTKKPTPNWRDLLPDSYK